MELWRVASPTRSSTAATPTTRAAMAAVIATFLLTLVPCCFANSFASYLSPHEADHTSSSFWYHWSVLIDHVLPYSQTAAVVFASMVCGVLVTLLTQAWLMSLWFQTLPVEDDNNQGSRNQYTPFSLPKELKYANDNSKYGLPEDFLSINMLMQFIFQEIKDTRKFRNFVMEKVHIEFSDLLKSNAGKMLNHLSVRDLNIGSSLPMLQKVRIIKADMKANRLETLVFEANVKYNGQFQLGVNVGSIVGKGIFAIGITKLVGTIQVKFTREPFTHWSLAFTKDPILEFDVESQYLGRQFNRITDIITNLFRRMIRKKHTLPNYKIRYKPFFTSLKPKQPDRIETVIDGDNIIRGSLDVKVIEITRLKESDNEMYCLISLDNKEWNERTSMPPSSCQPNCEQLKNKSDSKSIQLEENSEYVNINLSTSPSKNSLGSIHSASSVQSVQCLGISNPLNESAKPKLRKSGSRSSLRYNTEFEDIEVELENEIEKIINDKEICTDKDKDECDYDGKAKEKLGFNFISCNCARTKKTNFFKPSRDITFNQRFRFDNLTSNEKFVNITIVRYIEPSKDKVGRIVSKEQHIPMAYVCLSMNDIATQCLTTKQGDTVQFIQFNVAPGITRLSRRNSYNNIEGRRGFDESLCHGDIRILFKHTPRVPGSAPPPPSYQPHLTYSQEMINMEDLADFKNDNPSKMHAFQRANFHNVTYCKFCHKKIWMKTAFQCQKCLMVCHKKCTERCMQDTVCPNILCHGNGNAGNILQSLSDPETKVAPRGSYKNLVPNLSRLKRRNNNFSSVQNNKTPIDAENRTSPTQNEFKSKQKSTTSVGDLCATSAREMGKDLFINMEPAAREHKLNEMISQVKEEIVKESMAKEQNMESSENSYEERIETLNLLMLHYCSGLNHCLQQSAEALREKTNSSPDPPEDIEITDLKIISSQNE